MWYNLSGGNNGVKCAGAGVAGRDRRRCHPLECGDSYRARETDRRIERQRGSGRDKDGERPEGKRERDKEMGARVNRPAAGGESMPVGAVGRTSSADRRMERQRGSGRRVDAGRGGAAPQPPPNVVNRTVRVHSGSVRSPPLHT